jgi:hypothetical protein
MTPNTDERLASIVRALTEVVLPHLPPEASLAQEQVHLAIGHLQILRGQLDDIPAFEREEFEDTKALAFALSDISGGEQTSAAQSDLQATAAMAHDDARSGVKAINRDIEALVNAASVDGSANAKAMLSQIILRYEHSRVQKDRRWFLPFGFDTMETAA